MAEEKKDLGKTKEVIGGQQPSNYGEQPLLKKGYQPAAGDAASQTTAGNIDTTAPPQGGSGVSSGTNDSTEKK